MPQMTIRRPFGEFDLCDKLSVLFSVLEDFVHVAARRNRSANIRSVSPGAAEGTTRGDYHSEAGPAGREESTAASKTGRSLWPINYAVHVDSLDC